MKFQFETKEINLQCQWLLYLEAVGEFGLCSLGMVVGERLEGFECDGIRLKEWKISEK